MRISDLVNRAVATARNTTPTAPPSKQPVAVPKPRADHFEPAAPGPFKREARSEVGSSTGRSSVFAGARAGIVATAGHLKAGASAGVEARSPLSTLAGEAALKVKLAAQVGAEGSSSRNGFTALQTAGAGVSAELGLGLGRGAHVAGHVFAGVAERLELSARSTGVAIGAEAFIGARAGGEYRQALTDGVGLRAFGVHGEGWAGFGVKADGAVQIDSKARAVHLKAELGAACFLGAAAGADVTFGG